MTQNIYDDPGFFQGYSRLPRSIGGLDAAPEWPSLRAMLPPMEGLRVVDLGCGWGWFCRWARDHGAAQVLGIDVSSRMLAQARAKTSDAAITYRLADLEELVLPAESFDLAYSSLAFHYVAEVSRLYGQIAHCLRPGGRLIFSTEHPIYMASATADWLVGEGGAKVWPVDSYFIEGLRRTDWLAEGVAKYHRTLATTVRLLLRSGFKVEQIEEFCPTAQQIAELPTLAEELQRPMFLLMSVSRQSSDGR